MDKDRLHDLAQSGDFIPGIYNYCDRWCERCPLTSKCENYATTEEYFSEPGSRDISNAAFWSKISEIFRNTMELILEDADKRGIDLKLTDEESKEFESREKVIKTATENNICARKAKRYMKMVTSWFEKSEPIFESKGKELQGKAVMELPGSDPEKELIVISDSTDMIHWYQHQIYVKIMRALRGVQEDRFDQEDWEGWEEFPNDSNGSAKVALIGIDRSIGAWGYLMGNLSGNSDDILDMLVLLEQLRKNVEEKFPDARGFVRPGFDDIV